MKTAAPTEVNATAGLDPRMFAQTAGSATNDLFDAPPIPLGGWPRPNVLGGRLLARLMRGSTWTSNEWQQAAGASRLAATVNRLRNAGWNIDTEPIDVPTGDGHRRARIGRYSLAVTDRRNGARDDRRIGASASGVWRHPGGCQGWVVFEVFAMLGLTAPGGCFGAR